MKVELSLLDIYSLLEAVSFKEKDLKAMLESKELTDEVTKQFIQFELKHYDEIRKNLTFHKVNEELTGKYESYIKRPFRHY